MLTAVHEKMRHAYAEASWIVAGWADRLYGLRQRQEKMKEPVDFEGDPMRALVYYSNPDLGLSHGQTQSLVAEVAGFGSSNTIGNLRRGVR